VVGAVSETLSWNAYPWYINRLPRAAGSSRVPSRCGSSAGSCPCCGSWCYMAGRPGTAGGGWHAASRPGIQDRGRTHVPHQQSGIHRAARSPGSTHGSA